MKRTIFRTPEMCLLRRIGLACAVTFAVPVDPVAWAAPAPHLITFHAEQIIDTPFALPSLPAAISAAFVVDDSILQPGMTDLIELPSFSLLEPIVIGDAAFSNASIQVAPGGRVVNGELVEVFLHAIYLDPLEGQHELTTYFFPAFQWYGTDFNPDPPSEFVFGSYSITRVPEPTSFGSLALAGAIVMSRIARRSTHFTLSLSCLRGSLGLGESPSHSVE